MVSHWAVRSPPLCPLVTPLDTDTAISDTSIVFSATEGYVLPQIVCFFGLFVTLLATSRKNYWSGLYQNFTGGVYCWT